MEQLGRNEKCWCGSGRKYKQCHRAADERIAGYKLKGHIVPDRDLIKNERMLQGIRESGRVNTAVLDAVAKEIKEGMTTARIDAIVSETTAELGGVPAPLHYEGFPKSVCTSVNDQVCHGIPSDDVILRQGDIVNVDVSTLYAGYYSDSSRMFLIGDVEEDGKRLVNAAKEAVKAGLKQVKPYGFIGDIGQAIQDYINGMGYSVVLDYGGHGVGLAFHEEPMITYIGPRETEMLLAPGMVFTIEPMVNAGCKEVVLDERNGWTVYTADGSMSAQWEVTVAVTESGYEILAY